MNPIPNNLIKTTKHWILLDKIIDTPNSKLYNVSPIIDENTPEEDRKDLSSRKWIVKFSPDNVENTIIESLKLYDNNLCIKIPKNILFRNNGSVDNNWYTMEKYETTITQNYIFARKKIKQLGLYMIKFFEWLHVKENKIHGDIKPTNIMINKKNKENPFIIIDYETIGIPDLRYKCTDNDYINYYYFYIGCDYDKPYFSYRMDLQALGYILYALVLSIDEYHIFPWQELSHNYYLAKSTKNFFGDLIKLRPSNIKIENILINKYFEIINEQGWESAPNPEVYNKLKELFTVDLLNQAD